MNVPWDHFGVVFDNSCPLFIFLCVRCVFLAEM